MQTVMKKMISLLILISFAINLLPMTASAMNSDIEWMMYFNKSAADVGDIVTLSIEVKPDSVLGLGGCDFNLEYDITTLEYVSGTFRATDMLEVSSLLHDERKGVLQYAGVNEVAVMRTGIIATAQFKVVHPNGTIQLKIRGAYLGDFDFTDATASAVANSISTIVLACNHGLVKSTTIKLPTCREPGEEQLTCEACGESLGVRSIPISDHSCKEWTVLKSPTCIEDGEEMGSCSICGAKLTRTIAALGHTDSDWIVERMPSCSESGLRVKKCARCDMILLSDEIPANGHKMEEWEMLKEPTCTEDGLEHGICSSCGKDIVRFVAALGHACGDWEVYREPTCSQSGLQVQKCVRCGEILNSIVLSALGHKIGELETIEEPTCTKEGKRALLCMECGTILWSESIAATGHTPGEWVITKESTYTEPGEEVCICTVCGEIAERRAIEKLQGILGDVNQDGKITAVDARWILQHASGLRAFSAEQIGIADLNGDGRITAVDARWTLQIASGIRPNPSLGNKAKSYYLPIAAFSIA